MANTYTYSDKCTQCGEVFANSSALCERCHTHNSMTAVCAYAEFGSLQSENERLRAELALERERNENNAGNYHLQLQEMKLVLESVEYRLGQALDKNIQLQAENKRLDTATKGGVMEPQMLGALNEPELELDTEKLTTVVLRVYVEILKTELAECQAALADSCAANEKRQEEIDRLLKENEKLRAACDIYREAICKSHNSHFDRTGQHGLGCNECHRAKGLIKQADELIDRWWY